METYNKKKKKKRKTYHHYYVTVTNDPNATARNHRMSRNSITFWIILIVILVMAIIGFIGYVNYNSVTVVSNEQALRDRIEELQTENSELTADNEALNEKINILSETVNQKVEAEQVIEEQSIPNGFPMSGASDFEEKDEELRMDGETIKRPMLEFTAPDGSYVVASGDGTVSLVAEETTYGYEVQIDHGNGYISVYRTNTEPKVKEGDEVARGLLIYEVESDDDDDPAKVCYQIIKDGEYINPADLLEING